MPMKVRYTVVNGEVIAENRGGVRKTYVPDPLGSTIALLDNTQRKTDTFSYWPYGETKSRTGTTATPFRFVGTLGYYRDSERLDYVRARYFRKVLSRWISPDTFANSGATNAYDYAGNSPTTQIDPSGQWVWRYTNDLDSDQRGILRGIMHKIAISNLTRLFDCLEPWATDPSMCGNLNLLRSIGDSLEFFAENTDRPDFELTILYPGYFGFRNRCNDHGVCAFTDPKRRPPRIHVCRRALSSRACGPLHCLLLHEIIHATGVKHRGGNANNDAIYDCLKLVPGCEQWGAYAPGERKHS